MAARALKEAQVKLSAVTRPGFSWPTAYKPTKIKLQQGIWPWENGFRSRLPEHYKQRYMELFSTTPRPIHYVPEPERRYTINDQGFRIPYHDTPIPLVFPPEADKGLWGGEGIIEGIKQRKGDISKEWSSRIWKPTVVKRILYSEILDRWMAINVTSTTMERIEEVYGFDFYILKTHEVDLRSKLGMKLRRDMLQTLADKSMHPDNPEKRDHVYEKYKEFIVPVEEIPWMGLDILEAELKQQMLEEAEYHNATPKKYQFYKELIHKLENKEVDEPKENVLQKLNPFKKQPGQKD